MPTVFTGPANTAEKNNPPAQPGSGSMPFSKATLGSFMLRPPFIKFETQEPNEQVILFLRQHFIVNIGWIAATILLLLIPGFVRTGIAAMPSLLATIPASYFLVLPLIWYTGVLGFALTSFLSWYFNVYIVTNERIVDIDWVNLLYKRMSTAKLNKIEDVTSTQGGFTGTLFDYGNVNIQTAGTEENFEFLSVPQPNEVVKQVNELIS